MIKLVYLAIGGAIGALSRFGVSQFFYTHLKHGFPWSTLYINVFGSFLIGLLWGIFQTVSISNNLRALIFIGFLGAFTTFSAYSLEIFTLIQNNHFTNAVLYIFLSNFLGIVFVFTGFYLSKLLI